MHIEFTFKVNMYRKEAVDIFAQESILSLFLFAESCINVDMPLNRQHWNVSHVHMLINAIIQSAKHVAAEI